MKRILFALAFLLTPYIAHAATATAASCSRADVVTAYGLVSNGDTIAIPSGTCSWASKLVVTKDVSIIGAGIDITIIQDDEPRTTTADGTVFSFNTTGNWRLSAMTITHHNETTINGNTTIRINGTATGFRVDHVKFDSLYAFTLIGQEGGSTCGVADHNTAVYRDIFAAGRQASWQGVGLWGDNSWHASLDLGSACAFYIENNELDGSLTHQGVTDGEYGARMVVRFNHIIHDFVGSHGTESSQRIRGTVYVEVYGNDMEWTPSDDWDGAVKQRSGIAMIFKNTMNGYLAALRAINYRTQDPYQPWKGSGAAGEADGTSVFDNNLNGGTAYETGTHTGSNGVTVLTDGAKSWTVSQWSPTFTYPGVGYSGGTEYAIINLTRGWSGYIGANTATTITNGSSLFGSSWTWNNGDSYAIKQAYPALDQVGWSGGDLLSGGDNGTSPTPAAWPNQTKRYAYVWGNTGANGDGFYPASSQHPHINIGRDVIVDGGSPGVTEGTSLPGTCTVGAGFWKTNEGSWNDGSNANYTGQGVLYKCTSTNTWTLYYTPYNFPNPLTLGPISGSFTITPSSIVQGTTGTYTINGIGTVGWVDGYTNLQLFNGAGVTVNSTTCPTAILCMASITAAANASTGPANANMVTIEP